VSELTPTQSYIFIAALMLLAAVAVVRTLARARERVAQLERQRVKWRARLDEVRNNPDLLVHPPA